jgi:hypothetical protein
MAGDEFVRGVTVAVLAPTLGVPPEDSVSSPLLYRRYDIPTSTQQTLGRRRVAVITIIAVLIVVLVIVCVQLF